MLEMTILPQISPAKRDALSAESYEGIPTPDRPTREEERLLVERAVDRDAEAFAELYDRNVVRVYRHIYYLVNDAREAEDLTAQTFLKAWEAIDRYKERGAPIVAWF